MTYEPRRFTYCHVDGRTETRRENESPPDWYEETKFYSTPKQEQVRTTQCRAFHDPIYGLIEDQMGTDFALRFYATNLRALAG